MKVGLKGEIDLKNSKTFYKFAVEIFSIPHDNTYTYLNILFRAVGPNV
jgi:hypothetical protein